VDGARQERVGEDEEAGDGGERDDGGDGEDVEELRGGGILEGE
jgi:hypothetical protein